MSADNGNSGGLSSDGSADQAPSQVQAGTQPPALPAEEEFARMTPVAPAPVREEVPRAASAFRSRLRSLHLHKADLPDLRPVLRAGTAGLLDVLYPPACPLCAEPLEHQAGLCADCWSGLDFFRGALCGTCGRDFPDTAISQPAAAVECSDCIARPPRYDRLRSALHYTDVAKRLVIGLKERRRFEYVPLMLPWLQTAGRELLAEADVILPVPLHWSRLLRRQFNQSALLAEALSRRSGVPVLKDALVRTRRTPQMRQMTRRQRAENVRGVMSVRPGTDVSGARVLLVDDVYTTGATLRACTSALLRQGAQSVDLLTLARVL